MADDGGRAFPLQFVTISSDRCGTERRYHRTPGMSLRAYAAVAAMEGMLQTGAGEGWPDQVVTANRAASYADALIAELKKEIPDG
jgi:hypothetical protein